MRDIVFHRIGLSCESRYSAAAGNEEYRHLVEARDVLLEHFASAS
jgi:hypothetical protein